MRKEDDDRPTDKKKAEVNRHAEHQSDHPDNRRTPGSDFDIWEEDKRGQRR